VHDPVVDFISFIVLISLHSLHRQASRFGYGFEVLAQDVLDLLSGRRVQFGHLGLKAFTLGDAFASQHLADSDKKIVIQ